MCEIIVDGHNRIHTDRHTHIGVPMPTHILYYLTTILKLSYCCNKSSIFVWPKLTHANRQVLHPLLTLALLVLCVQTSIPLGMKIT